MNTAQVSIELVLAGILALCAFVLPFFGGTAISRDLLQSEALIGLLGLAYLLGVIFDKLSDALLGPLEHILRLRQADAFLNQHEKFRGKDAYPQSHLEFRLRKADDGRLDWMNSLKSRIRTSREMAVLGLPATMGIAIFLTTAEDWMLIAVALNLLIFIASALLEGRLTPIKTDALSKNKTTRREQMKIAERKTINASMPYYLLLAISIVTILAITLRAPGTSPILWIGAGGLTVSLLALWACLRITRTYIKFVAREMSAYLKEKDDEVD
ncbi:MAG: hypothetical protein IT314_00840 [Anaerolineales bacterium]|nr:hypothetical protein [Anaerolineales bacterium]